MKLFLVFVMTAVVALATDYPAKFSVKFVNKGTRSTTLSIQVYGYDENEVELELPVAVYNETVLAGQTFNSTYTVTDFVGLDYPQRVSRVVAYNAPVTGSQLVGASLLLTNTGSPPVLKLGNVAYDEFNGDVPLTSFSVHDPILPDTAKTVWKTTEATDLTANLYREGVDKIVGAIYDGPLEGAGGGGGSVDLTDTNIETIAGHALTARDADTSARSNVAAASNAAVTAYETAHNNSVVRNQPQTVAGVSGGTPSADFWTVHLPLGHGQFRDVNLNPLDVEGVSVIAQWVRIVIGILAIYFFEVWCWEQYQSFTQVAQLLPQARGNPVAMGTGAQAGSLLSAVAISVILTSLPALMFGVYTAAFTVIGSFFDFGTIKDVMPSDRPNYMTEAFIIVNAFVPTTLLLLIAGQMFIVRKAGMFIYNASGILIKFIIT